MLYTYKPIRHDMRKMHAFVAYIFVKVWCKAPSCEYSIDLFSGMPDLLAIMEQLIREDQAGKENGAGAFFFRSVNEIFIGFKALSPSQIKHMRKMFLANNNIQALCKGRINPFRYPLEIDSTLHDKIKKFFSGLYSSGFFNLTFVKRKLGADLHDHYNAFAKANELTSCPFCGLQPMDTDNDPTKEAYDHYLPSSIYPFNSVNFKNLAPACHKCNSQYKLAKDPLAGAGGKQRRAFYPYALNNYPIQASVQFLQDMQPTNKDQMVIGLKCDGFEEEIKTWDALYNITERFAARCCSPASKAWTNRIRLECRNYGKTPEQALEAELLICSESPWTEAMFLKAAYLREMNRVGLISSTTAYE